MELVLSKRVIWKSVFVILWLGCFVSAFFSCYSLVDQYFEKRPVTSETFFETDQIVRPGVEICNTAFLDPEKVINYKGADFNFPAFKEFQDDVIATFGDGNSQRVLEERDGDSSIIFSRRILDYFKLDIDRFFISCSVRDTFANCNDVLHWTTESDEVCFKSENQVVGLCGETHAQIFYLYFDPNVHLGRYTHFVGATVKVNGATDDLGPVFVQRSDLTEIKTQVHAVFQDESLPSLACTRENTGLRTYSFTGMSFEATYEPRACIDLCLAETTYSLCGCSYIIGYNITNTECLEDETNRKCLNKVFDLESFSTKSTTMTATETAQRKRALEFLHECIKRCVDLCERHYFVYTHKAVSSYPSAYYLIQELLNINKSGVHSPLTSKLLQRIWSENTRQGQLKVASEIASNVAKIVIYSNDCASSKATKIEAIMTWPTLFSNVGGTVGIWLGLSIVSLVEACASFVQWVNSKSRAEKNHQSVSKVNPVTTVI